MNIRVVGDVCVTMNTIKTLLWIALFTFPTTAAAQTRHITVDPTSETERCQNHHAAFQKNGDVVVVEYQGQWRVLEDGRRIRNAGKGGFPCEIERVVRLTPERKVVWAIRPTHDAAEHGVARQDRLRTLLAAPDGGTIMSVSDGLSDEYSHSRLLYVEKNGDLRWVFQTKKAPRHSMFEPHIADDGQLFVTVGSSNFGYDGGVIQLPGGESTRLRKHQDLYSLARINPATGQLMWERAKLRVLDTNNQGIVAFSETFTGSPKYKRRFVITQLSPQGSVVSKATTPWLKREEMLSAIYDRGHVFMTTREQQGDTRENARRIGNLRVFDMKGRMVHTRQLADGSRLANRAAGAPVRIISPTDCVRDISKYVCVTNALNIITLKEISDEGAWSRVKLPRGGLLESESIDATSTRDGLWLSTPTYYNTKTGDTYPPGSVTALYSPDDMRTPIEPDSPLVWRPAPRTKSATHSGPPPISF